jgi:hypothetical protein
MTTTTDDPHRPFLTDEAPERMSWLGVARVLPEPGLDRAAQDRLGALLRGMYASYLEQPVPEELRRFVDQLGQE